MKSVQAIAIDEPSCSSEKREGACAQASGSLGHACHNIAQSICCTDHCIKLMVSDQATEAQAFFNVTARRAKKNPSSIELRVRLQKSSETVSGSGGYSALGQDDLRFRIHKAGVAFDDILHGHTGAQRVQIMIHRRGYNAKRHWVLNLYDVPV